MAEFYGPTASADATATLHAAFDLGVNFFDTADMYGHGRNEEMIGQWLRSRRARVRIATKFGVVRGERNQSPPINTRPEYVRSACERSLERLRIETIDLYYMHRKSNDVPIEDTVGAMADLLRAGKIGAIGLCEVSLATLRRAHAVHPIAAVQSELSLMSREQEADVLPWCRATGTAFVAYSPLARGALAAAPSFPEGFAPDDFRRALPRFEPENWTRNYGAIVQLQVFAAERGLSAAQVALAWILCRHGAVPIPGARTPARMAENAAADSIFLTEAELDQLESMFRPESIAGDRVNQTGRQFLDL